MYPGTLYIFLLVYDLECGDGVRIGDTNPVKLTFPPIFRAVAQFSPGDRQKGSVKNRGIIGARVKKSCA